MTDITVVDNPGAARYEARVGGELAGFSEYLIAGRVIVFKHTEVDPRHEGEGVGAALTRFALDRVRERGDLEVVPTCPFVAGWIGRHPDYLPLVTPSMRARFRLEPA